MDVACFCGCRFSEPGPLGACPACGEYVGLSRISAAEAKELSAALDLLLSHGERRRLAERPPHNRG